MSVLLRQLMSRLMAPEGGGEGGGGGGGGGAPGAGGAGGGSGGAGGAGGSGSGAGGTGNPLLDSPLEDLPAEWRDHARKLRSENAQLRARLKGVDDAEAKAKLDEQIAKATADAKKAAEELIAQSKKDADARVIRAELKAAALRAGLIDVDALKLIDTSKLTLNADGEVDGIDALLTDLQKNKAYLFQAPRSSSTSRTPSNSPAPAPSAKDLLKKDPVAYEAALKAAKGG